MAEGAEVLEYGKAANAAVCDFDCHLSPIHISIRLEREFVSSKKIPAPHDAG